MLLGGIPGAAIGGVAGGVVAEGAEAVWPFLPAWAQPGQGHIDSQQSEEISQAIKDREQEQTKSFASWGIGFRRFIRGGGL